MISDAELTALYGNGLRPDTAARLIDDLRDARARLAESAAHYYRAVDRAEAAEAERDRYDKCWINAYHRGLRHRARAEAAEARLAEVEVERDDFKDDFTDMRDGARRFAGEGYFDLRAKLAAVEAERDVLASKAVRIFERSAEPDPLLGENRDLRARLAEVEAERDWMVAERATQFEEVAQSRARLAEVEAERDQRVSVALHRRSQERADAAEAKLAAVSEELDRPTDLCPPAAKRDRRYASQVIADMHGGAGAMDDYYACTECPDKDRRLAEVEAEYERYRADVIAYTIRADQNEGAQARAEAVEAERDKAIYDRDCARLAGQVYQRQCEAMKARLAAVEKLWRDHDNCDGTREAMDPWAVRDVLAAVDDPADHRPCPHPELDGYGRCLSCDEPAEGTNGDEGPYTEEQIRETFDRLGDETNQDDFMYNLRWGGPDWSNFMKPRRAAVDGPPADHIALFDGPPLRSAGSGAGSTQDGDDDA